MCCLITAANIKVDCGAGVHPVSYCMYNLLGFTSSSTLYFCLSISGDEQDLEMPVCHPESWCHLSWNFLSISLLPGTYWEQTRHREFSSTRFFFLTLETHPMSRTCCDSFGKLLDHTIWLQIQPCIVYANYQLSFSLHTTSLACSYRFLLYNIRRIQPFLSTGDIQVFDHLEIGL